jgi:hypothetical protein
MSRLNAPANASGTKTLVVEKSHRRAVLGGCRMGLSRRIERPVAGSAYGVSPVVDPGCR